MLFIRVKTRCQGMITTVGFGSSEIRIEVSEVVIQMKTSHQGVITRDGVEISHSSQEETGNDNIYWIQIRVR